MNVGELQANSLLGTTQDEKLKKVCTEFSSLFISMLWKEMRSTIPENDWLPKSNGEKIFQAMMDDELSKEMAQSESFSLSKVLYDQLRLGITNSKK